MGRPRVFTIAGNLPQMVCAHFHDGHFRIRFNFQQGQGYADMIIQVSFRCICAVSSGKNGMYQFLGGGFSIASGDGDKRNSELIAVMTGQRSAGLSKHQAPV